MTDPTFSPCPSLALDPVYLGPPDGARPAPHESHTWRQVEDRWRECRLCGVRQHWPGAADRCSRPTSGRRKIDDIDAWNALVSDLERFFAWWLAREDTPDNLPSVEEWLANFMEWRRV